MTRPIIEQIDGESGPIGFRVLLVVKGTLKTFFCKTREEAESIAREYLRKQEAANG